jgi:hypothetical protein
VLSSFSGNAIYLLQQCYLHSPAMLSLCFSDPKAMLRLSGGKRLKHQTADNQQFIKSLYFAIFSTGGRLFHFNGSICVKKLVSSLQFCPKVPLLDKNHDQINCSK